MNPDHGLGPGYVGFVKDREGFVPHAYQDVAGYWTIGYGHRCDPSHPPVTEPQATEILLADLRAARDKALIWSPGLADESENRMAAITDFCFNAGAGNYMGSTLKLRVNEKNWPQAAFENSRWVHSHDQNGRVMLVEALVRRRAVTSKWLLEG